MDTVRAKNLAKNFHRIFWIRAFLHVKMINIVLSLFYLHRGITLREIMYLTALFSIVTLITEVPSSWAADKWGRKKTIMLGVFFMLTYWVAYLFANDFWWFAAGTVLYATGYAFISGTDEAVLYDTGRELNQESEGLERLGKYHAADKIFKSASATVAAFIAQGLTEGQFEAIILVDVVAVGIAFLFSLRLTEPHHHMDVEKIEQGVFLDAFTLLKNNKALRNAVISKVLIFSAFLSCWAYFQEMYTALGVSVIMLGIIWSLHHLITATINMFSKKIVIHGALEHTINVCNILFVAFFGLIVVLWFWYPAPYLLYTLFVLAGITVSVRFPLYSAYFNKASFSFNRATTLSLTNFIKSVLDIPLLFIGAAVIGQGLILPYMVAVIAGAIVLIFFRFKTAV